MKEDKKRNFPEHLSANIELQKQKGTLYRGEDKLLKGFVAFAEWAFWSAVTSVEANIWEESALGYLGSITGEGHKCGTFGVGDLDEHFLEMAWRSAEVCVKLRKAIGVIS